MKPSTLLGLSALLGGLACGSDQGTHSLPPSTGQVTVAVTSRGSEDFQGIYVRVKGITLTPADGSAPVQLVTPGPDGLNVNLAETGSLSRLIGAFAAPVGTYRAATVTLGMASQDLALVPSGETPAVPASNIRIVGGAPGGTLALNVTLPAPLQVATGQGSVLDLEWDTLKPGFLTRCALPSQSRNVWTVDFTGTLGVRRVADPQRLALLPVAGTVATVDSQGFQVTPRFGDPFLGQASLPQRLQVRLDSGTGTRLIDADAGTQRLVTAASGLPANLQGQLVRTAGVLQPDGSLLASRVWVSSGAGPGLEWTGRVMAVPSGRNEVGIGGMTVSTRQTNILTQSWDLDAGCGGFSPAGSPMGAGFPLLDQLAMGFTVTCATSAPTYDLGKVTLVDIHAADFNGTVTQADASGFALTVPVDRTWTLPYVADATPNGLDADGAAVSGFRWRMAGQDHTGAGARAAFQEAAAATVDLGGVYGVQRPRLAVQGAWDNAAHPGGWSAQTVEILPLSLITGTVRTAWVANAASFGWGLPSGQEVVVDVDAGTRFFQVQQPAETSTDPANPFPVLTSLDPATPFGQNLLATLLAQGAPVRVSGIPQPSGHLRAVAVYCYVYSL